MTRTKSLETDTGDFAPGPILFDPEQIGRSLREIAVDVIETEGNPVLSRWFHSGKDVELFIWSDSEKNVIKHQFTFFGQVVEWNVFEGVKTGMVIEEETLDAPGDLREMIRFDTVPDSRAILSAMRLVEFVTDLQDDERLRISDNLRLRVVTHPNSDDAFIRRYTEAFSAEQTSRPAFWKRFKRWFSGT